MSTHNVVEMLVKAGVLDDRQHDSVMSRARSGAGGHLVQQIAELGYATESTIARILSVELGLPRVDLSITPPEHEALALLDMKTCTDRFVLPVALRENGELLWLAMGDPTDSESMAVVRRKTDRRVRPVVAGPSEILREARKLYASPMTPGGSPSGDSGGGKYENIDTTQMDAEPFAPIELKEDAEPEPFEVVGITDDSSAPLERLAEQLGVPVPEALARRHRSHEQDAIEVDLSGAGESGTLLDARPGAAPQPIAAPPRLAADPSGLRGIGPTGQPVRGSQPGARPPPPPSQPGAPPPRVGTQTIRGWADAASTGPQRAVQIPGRGGAQTGPMRAAKVSNPGASGSTGQHRPVSVDGRPPPPVAPAPPPFAPAVNIDEVLPVPKAHGLARGDLSPEDVQSLESLRSSMEKGALVLRAVAELCVDKGLFTREEMRNRSK